MIPYPDNCRRSGGVMKFVLKKTSNDQFRFNLVASNGQTVATSESYTPAVGARHDRLDPEERRGRRHRRPDHHLVAIAYLAADGNASRETVRSPLADLRAVPT
jgi:hypothetical protein